MLRFLTPYLIAAAVITVTAGVAYGTAAVGVPAFYALLLAASLIAGIGYMRWDQHQHPHRDH